MSGHVLLAEDNEVNKTIVLAWLDRLGFTTECARNGREALALLQNRAFDLVLMDCQMPEMDGFAATAEIRRRETETGGHVPIIALTANAIEGDRDTCLRAVMDDYLTKPFKGPHLAEVIARWLPECAAAPPAAGPAPLDLAALAALCEEFEKGGRRAETRAAIEAELDRLRRLISAGPNGS
jgi:CheY-like chemotaxis protein